MNICRHCERHVYEDEPTCPFCGSGDARLAIPKVARTGRLSRSAVHAARAAAFATALGVTACYESHTLTSTRADTSAGDAGVGDSAADASEPIDSSVRDAIADTRVRDVQPDTTADTALPDTAEEDGDTPLYGGVFPDPRTRAVV